MKNKFSDLNDHLFAQMERLGDEGLKGDALKDEIARSKAVIGVSNQIVESGKVVLEAKALQLEYGITTENPQELLSGPAKEGLPGE